MMFENIPIIKFDTKDINIKIPMIYSEDIIRYSNYLESRLVRNQQVMQQWLDVYNELAGTCATIEPGDEAKARKCNSFRENSSKFITFQENTAQLIKSIRQNIKVLDQYKKFPLQLYQRIHVSDRYLTEVTSILSNFVGTLTYWMNINAARFSQYVDTIILIIGIIKTWQAIIDFSVNRTAKCAQCKNDNYDYYSCSLGFICPKLPVLPIPPFKIPNVFIDLSHIDLGINILLPNFNFVPTKIPLPEIPDLPLPPTFDVQINLNF